MRKIYLLSIPSIMFQLLFYIRYCHYYCVDNNVAVGFEALKVFTGSNATAIGSGAADVATSATFLTAVGKDALGALTVGLSNT